MALLWCEGFDKRTSWNDLLRWPYTWFDLVGWTKTINATGGPFGGPCFRATGTSQFSGNCAFKTMIGDISKTVSGTTLNIGFWYRTNYYNRDQTHKLHSFGATDNAGCFLSLNAAGSLSFLRWGDNAVIASGFSTVFDDNYHWIELSVKIDTTSSGFVKLYIDGVLNINYTGITASAITSGVKYANSAIWMQTGSQNNNGYVLLSGFGQGRTDVDDMIIWDDSGSSYNTFPLGAKRIVTQTPTSDSSIAYTRSTGANSYALIDEALTQNDVDWVDGVSVGNQDLYGMSAISGWTPQQIDAYIVKTLNVDPAWTGTRTFKHQVKLSATTSDGATLTAPSSYLQQMTPFYTKPGGGAWTTTDANAALPGYSVVA